MSSYTPLSPLPSLTPMPELPEVEKPTFRRSPFSTFSSFLTCYVWPGPSKWSTHSKKLCSLASVWLTSGGTRDTNTKRMVNETSRFIMNMNLTRTRQARLKIFEKDTKINQPNRNMVLTVRWWVVELSTKWFSETANSTEEILLLKPKRRFATQWARLHQAGCMVNNQVLWECQRWYKIHTVYSKSIIHTYCISLWEKYGLN